MTHQYRLGPVQTPKPLKILILATFIISILSALGDHIFPHAFGQEFGWLSPQQLLSLSVWGVEHLFLWQFLTYLFVHPLANGISFSFLLSLAFNTYLLWTIGTTLIERRGLAAFFSLYFLSSLAAGLAAFGLQTAAHSPLLFAGNLTALYGLLIAWIYLFPQAQLFLLLTIPVRAKWLVLSLLGANLLIDLSTGNWIYSCAYITAALFSYLYCRLFWSEQRPKKESVHYSRAKIYDFKTGRAILKDDEFLEEMLTKISLHGKKSLSWRERWRLRQISKKKKKPN
jgi:membrane associated rhomboid family serine protease